MHSPAGTHARCLGKVMQLTSIGELWKHASKLEKERGTKDSRRSLHQQRTKYQCGYRANTHYER